MVCRRVHGSVGECMVVLGVGSAWECMVCMRVHGSVGEHMSV